MKNKNRRRILIASTITASLLVILSVAFAALSTTLNINFSSVTQNALKWNVGFKGSSVTPIQEGTSDTGLSCGTASVTPSTVTISDSTLSKPDDKCTYPLTIENTGDISANLAAIAMSQPTNMTCNKPDDATLECGNITIKLKTESGADFTAGVTVEPGEEYDLNLIVHYTGTTLNSTPVTINSSKVTFAYKQAAKRVSSLKPDGIKEAPKPVCIRATTLHTEICTSSGGCNWWSELPEGTTITYGSLGTSGTLSTGDAFDCDVNGDGTYNPTTERFYYVTEKDADPSSEYGILIYNQNIKDLAPTDDRMGVKYHSDNINNYGPTVAYQELPSTDDWPNVSLVNQTRQIYTELGTTTSQNVSLPQFTYTNKVARFMTTQEISRACNIEVNSDINVSQLSGCIFMLENAEYATQDTGNGWWLENATSQWNGGIWFVFGYWGAVTDNSAGSTRGVRPVIEVKKTDIDY